MITIEKLLDGFEKNPCIESARPIFIECINNKIDVPESVLNIIIVQFIKDHKKLINNHIERIKAKSEDNKLYKDNLLMIALNTNTLEECYDQYRLKTNESVTDDALRKRLERHLDHQIDSYIHSQFQKNKYPFQLPSTLTSKLEFYASFTEDESD